MDNLRGLLGISRMNKVPNVRIRGLCRMLNGRDERIEKVILRWFGHVEGMENDRIAKRVYVGECSGSRSMGNPWKRWIDTVKDCYKKGGLYVRQIRKMVHDRNE